MQTKKEECRIKEKEVRQEQKGTALEQVMKSFCAHHRGLLVHILQETKSLQPEDKCGKVMMQRDVHGTAGTLRDEHSGHLCRSEKSQCVQNCCVCLCGHGVYRLQSVCLCMKSGSGVSYRDFAHKCSRCCVRSQLLKCPRTHSSVIRHAEHTYSITHSHCHCPSPPTLSPPPLSPKPPDTESSADQELTMMNTHAQNTQPPSLLPHYTHTDQTLTPMTYARSEHFIDLMDKFTDTLMEASEREWNVHTGDGAKPCDDTHLTEIITTVLHSSSAKDHNLKELFEKHIASEKRSPQTRSQRRQEVMQAISRSHDQPTTRRQSLHIKRDLAQLKSDNSKRKAQIQSSDTPISQNEHTDSPITHTHSLGMPNLHNQSQNTPISHNMHPEMTISHTEHPGTPIPDAQSQDTPKSLSQSSNISKIHTKSQVSTLLHAQSLDTVKSHIPDMPNSLSQRQEMLNSHPQIPDMPKSNQDTTNLQHQSPNTINSHSLISTNSHHLYTDNSCVPSRYTISSQIQIPDRLGSHTQSTGMPNTHCCTENSGGSLRSRRNIVRPQHLSSYVTEPRKMFACCATKNNNTPTEESPPSAVPVQLDSVSPKRRIVCKNETSEESHNEQQPIVKTHCPKDLNLSLGPALSDSTNSEENQYNSPIKLMLVSTIKGVDGVKYTLRSAKPHNHEELFDPCVKELCVENTNTEQAKDKTIQIISKDYTEMLSVEESANTEDLAECVKSITENESNIKRRPGRPKKLKAPMLKAVKRPIGRPRKSKPADRNAFPTEESKKQKMDDMSNQEDGNKNLKITVTYGRRKAWRMVCEGQVPSKTNTGIEDLTQSMAEESAQSTQAQVSRNKDEFSLVIPVEDRKSITHPIMCPKQTEGAGMRKPGRPAKVKISGISVTVTTVSPRKRKIHMKRDVGEPVIQPQAPMTELEQNRVQKTITEEKQASVRYSVRERRPSIHLLRCAAMSVSNTATTRSCKLVQKNNKIQQEIRQNKLKYTNLTRTGTNPSPQDGVNVLPSSVESLFNANLQWWPTSASLESLKEELNKRLKMIKETWVSDTSDIPISDEYISSAPSSSAVRMLFERDCSMDTLCSWFMQTTEAQSLAIVKKANNRNPCEVFQYSSIQASERTNVCSSAQAERLSKCIKKFATVVPMKVQREKSKICGTGNSYNKQHIFNAPHEEMEKSQQCDAFYFYRTVLDRAKSRFKTRTKKSGVDYKIPNEESGMNHASVSEHGQINTLQRESGSASAHQGHIAANAWSEHTVKECKVFLRKLIPTDTHSLSDLSNDCRLRFSTSSTGNGSDQHQTLGARKSILETETNVGTSTRQQSKLNRQHSYTNVKSPSPKRQRSSRGVMAAKWSDFILGPAR